MVEVYNKIYLDKRVIIDIHKVVFQVNFLVHVDVENGVVV